MSAETRGPFCADVCYDTRECARNEPRWDKERTRGGVSCFIIDVWKTCVMWLVWVARRFIGLRARRLAGRRCGFEEEEEGFLSARARPSTERGKTLDAEELREKCVCRVKEFDDIVLSTIPSRFIIVPTVRAVFLPSFPTPLQFFVCLTDERLLIIWSTVVSLG